MQQVGGVSRTALPLKAPEKDAPFLLMASGGRRPSSACGPISASLIPWPSPCVSLSLYPNSLLLIRTPVLLD